MVHCVGVLCARLDLEQLGLDNDLIVGISSDRKELPISRMKTDDELKVNERVLSIRKRIWTFRYV